MSLTQTDLTNVNVASYNANARYGRDFWVSPSGTGTYIRKQITDTQDKVGKLTAEVADLQASVTRLEGLLTQALAALPKA